MDHLWGEERWKDKRLPMQPQAAPILYFQNLHSQALYYQSFTFLNGFSWEIRASINKIAPQLLAKELNRWLLTKGTESLVLPEGQSYFMFSLQILLS